MATKKGRIALGVATAVSPVPSGFAIAAAYAVSDDAARVAMIISVVVITALCALSARTVFRPA